MLTKIKYLGELKNFFFYFILSFINLFLILYYYKIAIIYWITKLIFLLNLNFNNLNLLLSLYYIYTNIFDILISQLKIISFYFLLIFSPFLSYQILEFLKPALLKKEYFFIKKIFFILLIFFLLSLKVIFWNIFPSIYLIFLKLNIIPIINFNLFWEANLIIFLNVILQFYYIILLCIIFFICLILFFINIKLEFNLYRKQYWFLLLLGTILLNPISIETQIFVFIILLLFFESLSFSKLYINFFLQSQILKKFQKLQLTN